MESLKEKSAQSQVEGGTSPQPPGAGGRPRRYSPPEKLALIRAYEQSGMHMRDFCDQQGVCTKSLCDWRRGYAEDGEAGLEDKPNPRNHGKRGSGRQFSPDQKREAVEAWMKSGMTKEAFGKVWGVSDATMSKWVKRYRDHGPKGLERSGATAKPKSPRPGLPGAVKESITDVKQRFPSFGLRKIRDFLLRFRAVKVSPGSIRKTLREAKLETPPPVKKKHRKPAAIRRFERSKPRELWQSDITSFVLTHHSQRVYLVAFLDDYSRYVVAWGLHLQQKADMVIEALLEGIGRFGKPLEVLTDQGRQYFSWRGKGHFQKVLIREGIKHVVARSHHPQTVGKTERFWETVGTEFWDRVQPQDLAGAREKLAHFIAHYNHFRPHQGIDGLVPADRFFGAESQVRKAMEASLTQNELLLALGEAPRKPVFLVGTIGDQHVSLHGERGKLVIQTPEGGRQELSFDELGTTRGDEVRTDGSVVDGNRENGEFGTKDESGDQAAGEADEVASAAEISCAGESAVGDGVGGGETESARGGDCASGGVAGTSLAEGSVGETGNPAASDLATVAAGGNGNGGGPAQTAESAQADDGRDGRNPGDEGDGETVEGVGTGEPGPAGADRADEGDAVIQIVAEGVTGR